MALKEERLPRAEQVSTVLDGLLDCTNTYFEKSSYCSPTISPVSHSPSVSALSRLVMSDLQIIFSCKSVLF